MRLWDLRGADPSAPRVLELHTDRVNGLSFHPAGDRLATGSRDRTARMT